MSPGSLAGPREGRNASSTGALARRVCTKPTSGGSGRRWVRQHGSPGPAETAEEQCHIGTDTLSLARLGAEVSGLDFSASAITTKTYEWDHGLGEIVTALLDHGLRLSMLVEHDSVPWLALPGQMVQRDDGEFALTAIAAVAPLSYTLQAIRPE